MLVRMVPDIPQDGVATCSGCHRNRIFSVCYKSTVDCGVECGAERVGIKLTTFATIDVPW